MILKFLGELLGSWGRRSKGRGWGQSSRARQPSTEGSGRRQSWGYCPSPFHTFPSFCGEPWKPRKAIRPVGGEVLGPGGAEGGETG